MFRVSEVQFLGFIITPGIIRMDPRKVQAITNWPTLTNVKEVQSFLGFANFYRKFVRNFGAVAAPFSALTKGKSLTFLWRSEAEVAFRELPFVVEADASDVGVRNYDVGDRELLAVKLALEEWRHWLEGAQHQFLVLADHKNLEYIQQAKQLNPRQARWSLFFNHFQFTLSYRPGSKILKPDSLSRVHFFFFF